MIMGLVVLSKEGGEDSWKDSQYTIRRGGEGKSGDLYKSSVRGWHEGACMMFPTDTSRKVQTDQSGRVGRSYQPIISLRARALYGKAVYHIHIRSMSFY